MINWIVARLKEMSTWSGAGLVALSLMILLAGPLAKIAAWGAIGYGAWTIWKKED